MGYKVNTPTTEPKAHFRANEEGRHRKRYRHVSVLGEQHGSRFTYTQIADRRWRRSDISKRLGCCQLLRWEFRVADGILETHFLVGSRLSHHSDVVCRTGVPRPAKNCVSLEGSFGEVIGKASGEYRF